MQKADICADILHAKRRSSLSRYALLPRPPSNSCPLSSCMSKVWWVPVQLRRMSKDEQREGGRAVRLWLLNYLQAQSEAEPLFVWVHSLWFWPGFLLLCPLLCFRFFLSGENFRGSGWDGNPPTKMKLSLVGDICKMCKVQCRLQLI